MSRLKQISLVLALLLINGCSQKSDPRVSIVTDKTVSNSVVYSAYPKGATTSEETYAVVDSTKLKAYYAHFLKVYGDLTGQGAPHWDVNAECTAFAMLYVAVAKTEYYRTQFYTFTKATAPAMGEFWYTPTVSPTGHAIVTMITERGRIFIEPQPGQYGSLREVTLTKAELDSCLLNHW